MDSMDLFEFLAHCWQVPYGIVDILVEPERAAEAQQRSGASTVPQIFVGGRCLGGGELEIEGGLGDVTVQQLNIVYWHDRLYDA